MQQCIEAVDYCHQQNVAHRDLKLDNTLLNSADPPHVKICDFGFAKLMGSNNLMTNIGTPVYMAPQQIQKGKKGYDGRAAGAAPPSLCPLQACCSMTWPSPHGPPAFPVVPGVRAVVAMSHTCRVSTPYTSFPPHTHTHSLYCHIAPPRAVSIGCCVPHLPDTRRICIRPACFAMCWRSVITASSVTLRSHACLLTAVAVAQMCGRAACCCS